MAEHKKSCHLHLKQTYCVAGVGLEMRPSWLCCVWLMGMESPMHQRWAKMGFRAPSKVKPKNII